MTLYLVNFAATADWEAMRDDGGFDTIYDMAEPTGVVTDDIQKALAMFKRGYEVMWKEDQGDELLPLFVKWNKSAEYEQYELVHDGEHVGVAIARKVEVL